MRYGHWEVSEDFNPEDHFGFIYCIRNLKTGKEYIGRKFFRSRNGKAHRWKHYPSSCVPLREDIARFGPVWFRFEILECHNSIDELCGRETELLRELDVLNKPDKFYNRNISGKYFRTGLNAGPKTKGKTYDEIYGPEKAAQLRAQRSNRKGYRVSEELKEKLRAIRKGKTLEEMHGPEVAARMKEALRRQKGKPRPKRKPMSEQALANMRAAYGRPVRDHLGNIFVTVKAFGKHYGVYAPEFFQRLSSPLNVVTAKKLGLDIDTIKGVPRSKLGFGFV